MFVNTNLSAESAATNLQRNQSAPARSPARPASTPTAGDAADTSSVASAQNASTASPEINDLDAAQKSVEAARVAILSQSRTAVLAHANLSPETVFKLLQ